MFDKENVFNNKATDFLEIYKFAFAFRHKINVFLKFNIFLNKIPIKIFIFFNIILSGVFLLNCKN